MATSPKIKNVVDNENKCDKILDKKKIYQRIWVIGAALTGVLLSTIILSLHAENLIKVVIASAISMTAYIVTVLIIPYFATTMIDKGIWGYDLNKTTRVKIPEALGIVASVVFILSAIPCQIIYTDDSSRLLEYNAGLLAITFATLMGFVDDVIDLKWRYKIILPFFVAVPLLISYTGSKRILLPWQHNSIDMGNFFYVYIALLTMVSANMININAGINGFEVSQSIILSLAMVTFNMLELLRANGKIIMTSLPVVNENAMTMSLLLSLQFMATSCGILVFNWYPASVFVGDTYTYFAGVFIAVVSILGHSTKTVLLFCLPQLLNAAISLPQILKIVDCPKHRIPNLDPKTEKLVSSKNFTLLNLILMVTGPLYEKNLVQLTCCIQISSCMLGFFIRYFSVLALPFH